MTKRTIVCCFAGGLILLVWLFLGVERTAREHGTDYEFFAKQTPGFQVVFENPALCGECDLKPWGSMSQAARLRFADYCAARFGLSQVRPCYAIFLADQSMSAADIPRYSLPE